MALASMVGNPEATSCTSPLVGSVLACVFFFFLSMEGVCVNVLLELPSCVFIAEDVHMTARILGLSLLRLGNEALLCPRARDQG